MAVLCIAMKYWTSETEDSMKKGGIEGLKAHSNKLDKQVSFGCFYAFLRIKKIYQVLIQFLPFNSSKN